MKCRIFKTKNNGAAIEWFSRDSDDDYAKGTSVEALREQPFILVDYADVPAFSHVESLYFDGDCELKNLRVDSGWERVLMPVDLIKRRHLNRLNIEKERCFFEGSEQEAFLRACAEGAMIREMGEKSTYRLALKNLDRRVSDGEPDKPIIRDLLNKVIDV